MKHRIATRLALIALPVAWIAMASAQGKPKATFTNIVPKVVYEEATQRSLARIGALADKGSIADLRAEAVILAGYTMSAEAGKSTPELRQNAVDLAQLAGKKDGADGARKLAASIAAGKATPKVESAVKDWPAVIGNLKEVMMPFATFTKGGEGIHADLQYNAKVKNQNGSEALLNALAAKQLSDANAQKVSHELELLAYRFAVVGSISLVRGPDKGKGDVKDWNEQAIVMRDAAVELAQAARKKDAEAIFKASNRLENSCVECHSVFK
jgi:hypothetical protein